MAGRQRRVAYIAAPFCLAPLVVFPTPHSAGSAVLLASFALLGSRLIALIWSGLAAAAWSLVLLFQTRGAGSGATLMLWLLRAWLLGGIVLGVFSSVFGVLTGLCC